MELPQLNMSLEALAENVSRRALEELKPRNPKFKIGEEIKCYANIIKNDEITNICVINLKIKDMRYSPSLKDNICIVTLLNTVGQIEKYTTETDLINNIYEEVNNNVKS